MPLTELLTALGQQKGWNLVTGPEVNGQVTYRWRGVEPESAIRQLLKAHGWQVRIEGEFAVVEPLAETELPPIHVTETPTRTAALPEEERHHRIPDEAWEPIRKNSQLNSDSTDSGLLPPVEAEAPAIEEPRELAPQIPAEEDLSQSSVQPNEVVPSDEAEETPPQELASLSPAPRILPAMPSTMTRIFHPKNVSSQKLLPEIRPLLTEQTGEVTASPADASNAGSLLVKDHPQVISRVEELVRELDVPCANGRDRCHDSPAERSRHRPSLDSFARPCPRSNAGRAHSAVWSMVRRGLVIGHSQAGWTQIGGGLSCGTCAMTVEQVVTRLKSQATMTVTALAPREIADRQAADFRTVRATGFPPSGVDPSGRTGAEFVAEGLQVRLRPIVQSDGSVRLELTPRGPSGEQTGTAHADLPPDHCVVLGGLYFEHQMQITPASARSGSPQQMHEVVVLIRAKAQPQ